MRCGIAPLSVALLVVASRAMATGEVRKGPYLQHLSATGVEVRFELASPSAATVELRLEGQPPRTVVSPTAPFHSVHLTGLTPGTRYDYAVRVGPSTPRTGSFVTAPADASHDPITFIAYGDTRSDGAAHARITTAMGHEPFDFLVHTGDFVITGGDADAWQSFFDVEGPLLQDHCLFSAVGNHEIHDDRDRNGANFERYLGPWVPTPASGASDPSGLPDASPAKLYGTFRWGRARFFLLNAFQDWSGGAERTWLEQALNAADHEADLGWRIVVIHHGPFSAGPHGNNKNLLAAHIDDLLRTHHVDLVVAGHDHIYERGEAEGLKYVVTGGGGAPLYEELSPKPSTRKTEAAYHYVVTTLTDDALVIVTKRADGSLLERCTAGHGSWLCDPPPPAPAVAAATGPPDPPEHGKGCGCAVIGTHDGEPRMVGLVVAVIPALVRRRLRRGAT